MSQLFTLISEAMVQTSDTLTYYANPGTGQNAVIMSTEIYATLIGAVIGALASYFGASKVLREQIRYNNETLEKEREHSKQKLIKVINKLLKEEIVYNIKEINRARFFEYYDKGVGKQYGHGLNEKLKFNDFEEIKFQLIEFSNDKQVEDVVDFYTRLFLLARYRDLNMLSENEYSELKDLRNKIDRVLEIVDYQ